VLITQLNVKPQKDCVLAPQGRFLDSLGGNL